MKDLQRVIACLQFATEGDAKDDDDSDFLSKVANGKITFSSKITLAMSSQSCWRTGASFFGLRGQTKSEIRLRLMSWQILYNEVIPLLLVLSRIECMNDV